jgi:hypothetical protein
MRKQTLPLAIFLCLLLSCGLFSQLQPALLHSLGAVDGSFGFRPMSHQCAGLQVDSASISWLPAADERFSIGRFSVRYWVEEEAWPERPYCLGQDVWFGE